MTAHRSSQDSRAIAAARLLENLASVLPVFYQHISNEMRIADGYPSGASDVPGRGESELTVVERIAATRIRLRTNQDQIDDDLSTILINVHNMLDRCNTTLGIRVPVPRCTGGFGREGHLEWGDPTCTKIPSNPESTDPDSARRVMCDAHRMAESRWRKTENERRAAAGLPLLPSRMDEAA